MFPKTMEFLNGDYLALAVLPDGKLLITLTSEGWNRRAEFLSNKTFYGAWYEMFLDIRANTGFEYTFSVAEWGMMSDAPGFSDAAFILDDGSADVRHFWYYNQYQVKNELEELYTKGYLVWDYFECATLCSECHNYAEQGEFVDTVGYVCDKCLQKEYSFFEHANGEKTYYLTDDNDFTYEE